MGLYVLPVPIIVYPMVLTPIWGFTATYYFSHINDLFDDVKS